VKPGDTIEYYATAIDTAPGAPHTAATPAYRLAVISHDQYRELLQTQMRAEDLTRKYNDLMEQLGRLADKQAELEKMVSQLQTNLEQNGALTPPEQQQVQQALAAQDELAKQTEQFAKELTDEAKRPPVFDVEKDYKGALEKFAERMGQAKEAMTRSSESLKHAGDKPAGKEGLPALNSALQDQREALAQLGKNRDDYEKGVQQANRDIEKVYRLLEDSEMFKALLERQKNVERQVRSYKDVADPGLDERIRLKEFAEEQASVEQALAQLKEDFHTPGTSRQSTQKSPRTPGRSRTKSASARSRT
jgi:chromosome segregation ATPase